MSKLFTPYDEVRNNALKLAYQVYKDGFVPDVIYVPLRGGAYMGNVFSEFFKIVHKGKRPVFYAAVVARSYSDIHQQDNVMVDGWTYDPAYLRNGDKIIIIDDIFDSGRTLNHLVSKILEQGIPREDIKLVVHDYKIHSYSPQLPIRPDYFCRQFNINKKEDDVWIHYMSHELVGLTWEEQKEHFLKKDPALKEIFDFLNKQG